MKSYQMLATLANSYSGQDVLAKDTYENCPAGYRVKLPAENELFLDLDSTEAYEAFNQRLGTLQQYMEATVTSDRPSKTRGHRHVVVRLGRRVTAAERIALQAGLGSDPLRELLSTLRALVKPGTVTTAFYEKGKK